MKIRLDPLDILFSEFVRKRAISRVEGCEYCGRKFYDKPKNDGTMFPAWKQLQCSHFVGRRSRATRYDPENAVGACFSCHIHMTENPYEHTSWFEKHLGSEAFDKLIIRSNIPTKPDKEAIKLYLQEKIKNLEEL